MVSDGVSELMLFSIELISPFVVTYSFRSKAVRGTGDYSTHVRPEEHSLEGG